MGKGLCPRQESKVSQQKFTLSGFNLNLVVTAGIGGKVHEGRDPSTIMLISSKAKHSKKEIMARVDFVVQCLHTLIPLASLDKKSGNSFGS
jgi:hypothetical protein